MTEIVITPPVVVEITATSPNAYTITATQPDIITITAAVGNAGTVTSIATTAPITGGTITGSGTIGISAATTAAAGSMSASDKTKLDGIETGAKTGDVVGPSVASDTDVAIFDGITGKLIKDSGVQISTLITGSQVPGIENDAIWNAADVGTPNATDKIGIVQDGEPYLLKSIQYSALNVHAPVTIADTTSIDLSLSGQQVSAAAIFGTTSGLVAEGNHTHSYQPLDTELTAIAGLTSAEDKGIQFTGTGTAGTFDLTTAGKALLDDANAAAQRTTLSVPAIVATSVADNFVSFSDTAGAQKDSGKGLTHLVYTLQWGMAAGWAPADSTTYYFGGSLVQSGTAARNRIYFPFSGTIIAADFCSFVGTTIASNETSSAWIRIDDTTDTLISNAIKLDAAGRFERFANSSLSIAVTGDTTYFEIKWTTPLWGTNPTNSRQYGTVMIRC